MALPSRSGRPRDRSLRLRRYFQIVEDLLRRGGLVLGREAFLTIDSRDFLGRSRHLSHLAEELRPKKGKGRRRVHRVVFNEITKRAIEEAFKNPQEVDAKKVDAQQARRILDRLVGYKVSPILWEKVRRGLSAGRVPVGRPSAHLRPRARDQGLRSRGILDGAGPSRGPEAPVFPANLLKRDGKSLEIGNGEEAATVSRPPRVAEFKVDKIQARERKRNRSRPSSRRSSSRRPSASSASR